MLEKKEEFEDSYKKAVSFYFKKKFNLAKNFCDKALGHNPNHYEAYNLLGLIALTEEKYGDALTYFNKSLQINPAYISALNNLGMVYSKNNMHDETIRCCSRILELSPTNAQAHYSIADALEKKELLDDAIKNFEAAIKLEPNHFGANHNLGKLLFSKGHCEKAAQHLRTAIKQKSTLDPTACRNACYAVLFAEGKQAWREFLLALLNHKQIEPLTMVGIQVSLAVVNWIFGYEKMYLDNLQKTETILNSVAKKSKIDDVDFAYNLMLQVLVKWYKENPETHIETKNILYCLGDSHSITCSNKNITIGDTIYDCKTKFILGCKIWHITNDKKNHYKFAFQREISSLNKGSKIVLCLGEIDCRYDQGLFYRYRKYGTDLKMETNLLLDSYLEKIIIPIQSEGLFPLLWGIPAPREEAFENYIDKEHEKKFIDFIADFNEQMLLRAQKHSIPFVDNYSLSDKGNGTSDVKTHLDFYHLNPDVFRMAIKLALK